MNLADLSVAGKTTADRADPFICHRLGVRDLDDPLPTFRTRVRCSC